MDVRVARTSAPVQTAKSRGPDAPTLASSWRVSDVGPFGPDTLRSPADDGG
jgi:hypothetical protein